MNLQRFVAGIVFALMSILFLGAALVAADRVMQKLGEMNITFGC